MTQEEIKIKVPQWLPSLPRSEVGGSDLVGGERGGVGREGCHYGLFTLMGCPIFSRLCPSKISFVAKHIKSPVVTRDDVSMSAIPALGDWGRILNSQSA